jgi:formylglycine-generating enzyme required for sulfatase activity
MPTTRFFITHSWKDIDFARKLCSDLKANGLEGFLDAHSINPGDSIPSRIERGLKECDVYIPIFSPDALKSDWCDWEIDMAIVMNRTRKGRPRIIPVIAKSCDVPDRLMHILNINFVSRYDEALDELLTKVFGVLGKSSQVPQIEQLYQQALHALLLGQDEEAVMAFRRVVTIDQNYRDAPLRLKEAERLLARSRVPIPAQAQSFPRSLVPVVAMALFIMVASILVGAVVNSVVNSQPTATPTRDMPMVFIPEGEFTMGSNTGDDDEKPPHPVFLDAFWIDKFEVTNTQYAMCLNAGVCKPPSSNNSNTRNGYFGIPQFNNYPVVYVSWEDANRYCGWAGKRLPTEAEWEKAARGTDSRVYPWGNTFDKNLLNSYESGKGDTTAVGSYPPNSASPYGAMDMAGNVWEWVADWYGDNYYTTSPRNNPKGLLSGQYRVLRGGAWGSGYYTADGHKLSF